MVELPRILQINASSNLPAVALGAGAVAVGGGLVAGAIIRRRRKKNRTRRTHRNKSNRKRRSKGRKLKFGSKAYRKKYLKHGRRTPHTVGKRRDTSRRRIRYTSKGQPYVIGAKGKARFISKKSAKSSYHREGGKY